MAAGVEDERHRSVPVDRRPHEELPALERERNARRCRAADHLHAVGAGGLLETCVDGVRRDAIARDVDHVAVLGLEQRARGDREGQHQAAVLPVVAVRGDVGRDRTADRYGGEQVGPRVERERRRDAAARTHPHERDRVVPLRCVTGARYRYVGARMQVAAARDVRVGDRPRAGIPGIEGVDAARDVERPHRAAAVDDGALALHGEREIFRQSAPCARRSVDRPSRAGRCSSSGQPRPARRPFPRRRRPPRAPRRRRTTGRRGPRPRGPRNRAAPRPRRKRRRRRFAQIGSPRHRTVSWAVRS